ncbi:MAG: polysaccharide biosynthesis tyrosine autokinase [Bacteroidetes bacterium]|nr:polysaccharide biosynthesis tyrosine autokinase [Bacteroidota bacterium]
MAKDSFFITKDFDPLILKTVLKRNALVLVGVLIFCITCAFFYLRYTKPVYQSSILIQLNHDDKAKDVLQFENVNNDASLNSDVELLKSQLIFEQALNKLKVNVSVYHQGNILSEEKYQSGDFSVQPYALKDSSLIGSNINVAFLKGGKVRLEWERGGELKSTEGLINEHINNEYFDIVIKIPNGSPIYSNPLDGYFFTFNSVTSLSSKYLGNLSVTPLDPAAKTILIDFQAFHPSFCKDFLNALVQSFFTYDLEQKRKGSENVLKYIETQLDSLASELELSKDNLISYQRKANIVDPNVTESQMSGNITKFQEEITEQQQELRLIKSVNAKLKSEPSRLEVYRLLPEMFGSTFEEALSKRINELHEMLEKKEDLLYSVTEDNPQIKTLNTRIQIKMGSIRKSASIIEDRLKENIRLIQAKLNQIQGDSYDVPEKKLEFGRLRNIQDLNEKYFALFTERKVVYSISDAGFSSNHRILSRAEDNYTPISPDHKKIYSMALGLGFFMGFIFLFIKYVRFNEINYIEDLKRILPANLSYLGSIPKLEEDMEFSEVIVYDQPKSIVSEALRAIRTNLSFVNPKYKTIAISSSVSSEGKTFVALNLSAIVAMTNKKTVLIDLDLRKPKIHIAMNVPNDLGMSNAIIGQVTWQECVQVSGVENLDFISAGAIPPNPSELMLSKELANIIEEMKQVYDVIVFDNPPVGVVSDGVHMLAQADVPIYVFRANYSQRNFAERVEELVDVQKIQKLNIIMNGVVGSRKSYGYGYGYGNNYGYYEESKPKKSLLKRIFGK